MLLPPPAPPRATFGAFDGRVQEYTAVTRAQSRRRAIPYPELAGRVGEILAFFHPSSGPTEPRETIRLSLATPRGWLDADLDGRAWLATPGGVQTGRFDVVGFERWLRNTGTGRAVGFSPLVEATVDNRTAAPVAVTDATGTLLRVPSGARRRFPTWYHAHTVRGAGGRRWTLDRLFGSESPGLGIRLAGEDMDSPRLFSNERGRYSAPVTARATMTLAPPKSSSEEAGR